MFALLDTEIETLSTLLLNTYPSTDPDEGYFTWCFDVSTIRIFVRSYVCSSTALLDSEWYTVVKSFKSGNEKLNKKFKNNREIYRIDYFRYSFIFDFMYLISFGIISRQIQYFYTYDFINVINSFNYLLNKEHTPWYILPEKVWSFIVKLKDNY